MQHQWLVKMLIFAKEKIYISYLHIRVDQTARTRVVPESRRLFK